MSKVAIIGYGWVGRAMHELFPNAVLYDPALNLGTKELVNECDIAFVGVPTPHIGEGKLDTSIVEEVVKWCESDLIVIRSTLNPGDTARMSLTYNKSIVMQPEYLGETVNHPMTNQHDRPFVIIGGQPNDRRKLIDLYTTVYNANIKIRQVTATQAEIIKLSENRAIFYKVTQCQELYDVCQVANEDYYTIRDAVYGDDPRFNLFWTFIYPDQRGSNSKCIPKDVYAWCAWAESLGYDPKVTRALLGKNKEWVNDNQAS